MAGDYILLDDCGGYGVITLNRPEKRNAMSGAAQQMLQDVLRKTVGRWPVIILTGAGTAFCSGIDLKERRERLARGEAMPTEYSRQGHSWSETVEMIRKHPSVFIAAVNGHALGGGVSLINVCDLALAAEEAQIGMPEITFASYPTIAGPSTQLRILRKHAAWMILTGKSIDGRMAAKWGLVNKAVPADRLMEEAASIAARVAEHVESAQLSGVRGTPTFFIGDTRYRGPYDSATLIRAIEERAAQGSDHRRTPDMATWVSATAAASAASAGWGGAGRSRRIWTIRCTCSLSASPWPATASLTWFGEYSATSIPRDAASAMRTPEAWPTPMAVRTFTWNSTRSTATATGENSSSSPRKSSRSSASRRGTSMAASVRSTPSAAGRGDRSPRRSTQ